MWHLSKLHTYVYDFKSATGTSGGGSGSVTITIPRQGKKPFNFAIPIKALWNESFEEVSDGKVKFKMYAWAHKRYTWDKLTSFKKKQ